MYTHTRAHIRHNHRSGGHITEWTSPAGLLVALQVQRDQEGKMVGNVTGCWVQRGARVSSFPVQNLSLVSWSGHLWVFGLLVSSAWSVGDVCLCSSADRSRVWVRGCSWSLPHAECHCTWHRTGTEGSACWQSHSEYIYQTDKSSLF